MRKWIKRVDGVRQRYNVGNSSHNIPTNATHNSPYGLTFGIGTIEDKEDLDDKKSIKDIRQQQILNKFTVDTSTIKEKMFFIDLYSSRKTNLEYAKLEKPKISYVIELNDGTVKDVNKTVYFSLPESLSNKEHNRQQTEKLINLDLHTRFYNKDYLHLNYLSNKEKDKITLTNHWLNCDYDAIVEEL